MPETVRFDMRDWNRTFERYIALRSKSRQDITHQKARDFAFKTFAALPPTDKERIRAEMNRDKTLLKITVKRLQAKGIQLKGLPSVKVRRPKGAGGGTRMISGADKLISGYARKLLRSKLRSTGYHRVGFLILAQKLGASRQLSVNPRSMLNKTNVNERHSQFSDVYELNAVAQGMNCPSTLEARDVALGAMQADMEVYIKRKLDESRKTAGFK